MAGKSIIGSLYVALGLDSANFDAGAKKAQSSLAGLTSSIKGFAAGALGALSFGAVTAVLQATINRLDDLNKVSQKIGIPVEQLSGLEFAAKLADVSVEGLQVSMKKLNVQLAELAGGGTNAAGEAFKAMGISIRNADGSLKTNQQILLESADKFATYRDSAEKSALAVAIFGRQGLEMIPMLNAGSKGIQEATDQARAFGTVVTKEAAQAAEDFNDNLTRLTEAGRGLVTQLVSNILPTLVDVTNQFVAAAEKGGGFTSVSDSIKASLLGMTEVAMQTAHEFRALATIVGVMNENATKSDGLTASLDRWKQAFADIKQDSADTTSAIQKMYNTAGDPTGSLASIDKLTASMQKANEAAGDGENAPIVKTLTKVKTKTSEASKALEKLKQDGQDVFESTRTPIEKYQMSVAHLNELLAAGAINQDTYTRAVANLRNEFSQTGDTVESVGTEISNTFGSAFQSIIDSALSGTFDLKDSLKDLLNQLVKLSLNNVFTSLLGGGGGHPLYGGGGGLSGILGSLFGFAKGGTIMPGGTGGIDSQLVMFRKSPNERVDITKPGQSLGGGGSRVIVNDYRTNAPKVDVQQDGPDFTVVIRDEVNRNINQGYTDGAMGSRFGNRPVRTRR